MGKYSKHRENIGRDMYSIIHKTKLTLIKNIKTEKELYNYAKRLRYNSSDLNELVVSVHREDGATEIYSLKNWMRD
jgi:hypothetical protein